MARSVDAVAESARAWVRLGWHSSWCLVRLTKGIYSRILLIEPTISCLLRICFISCDCLSNRFYVYVFHLMPDSATSPRSGWHYDIKRIAPVFKPVVSWSCARQGRGCARKANSRENSYVSLIGGGAVRMMRMGRIKWTMPLGRRMQVGRQVGLALSCHVHQNCYW